MAVQTVSTALDNLATTTLHRTRRKFADTIFRSNPLSMLMLARGKVDLEPGGLNIREPLIYGTNPTVKSYAGYDELDVAPSEEVTQALYNWKLFSGSISIAGEEELKNSGPEAIFNLLKTKILVANKTMKQSLNQYLLQTQDKRSSKDFLSLDNLVEDVVAGSQGTVGGIDRSTYTWWRNKYSTGSIANITSAMRTFYNNVSENLETPDIILCTQDAFEAYEDQNAGKLRLQDTRLLQVGFDNFRFKGAVMVWEPLLSNSTYRSVTDVCYFLNLDYLRLALHRQRNFVMTKFMRPHNQDARVAQILVAGNMTLSNSRFQGALKLS
jgi:hypothetical protein